MGRTNHQLGARRAGATRNVSISYAKLLDTGETLTGGLTVTCTAVTISAPAISTGILTIDGATTPAAEAVSFRIAGGTAGTVITIVVDVDTSNSQHFDHDFVQEVI